MTAVAWNASEGNYMAIWHTNEDGDWDVAGQLFNSAGALVGSNFWVAYWLNDQKTPEIAYMRVLNRFMCVLEHYSGATYRWDIYGREMTSTGGYYTDGFYIEDSTTATDGLNSVVVFNTANSESFSSWQDYRAGNWDIYGCRLTPAAPTIAQEPKNNAQLIGGCTSTVYAHSGEFTWATTDMTIPGRGFPFNFTRTYRSGSDYDGPLGHGWTHSYDQRLSGSYGSDVTLYDGTGRKDVYTWDGVKYVAPAGFYDKLEYQSGPDTFTITDRYGSVRKFGLKGTLYKLVEIKDRNDNALTLNYDASNRLATIMDTLGRSITFTHTAEGRIDYFTDFYDPINPRKVDFTYDVNGDLWKVTSPVTPDYPAGKTTVYAYISGETHSWLNHNLASITDPKGQTFLVNTYNLSDQVVEQRYGTTAQKFYFAYEAGKTVETDRNGNITDYFLTGAGNCSSKVEYTNRNIRPGEANYTTTYEYNSNMELTRTVLPRGNSINYTFDIANPDALQRGNLLDIRRKDEALGTEPDIVTTYTYEPQFNQVKTLTDPRGYVTTFYLDYEEATLGDLNDDGITTQDNGNVVKIAYPTVMLGQPRAQIIETKFWYNENGQVTRAIDPEGAHTAYQYYATGDSLGYLWKVIRDFGGLGLSTEFAYDRVGNVTATTDPRGNTTTFEVNELNQVTKTIAAAPFNYQVKFSYDENDNLVQQDVQNLDENGVPDKDNPWITTTYTFDVLDNMSTRTEEVDHTRTTTMTYARDANENVIETTYPRGNKERVEYDERDLVYKQTRGYGSADAATDTTNYDANRNVSTALDGEGHETTYTWDGFDRQVRVTDPLGNYTESAYDASENLVSSTRRSSTGTIMTQATYQFDEVNRRFRSDDLFKNSDGVPVGDGLATRQYLHDRKGRQVATTDDNGNTNSSLFNTVDWLVKTIDALGDPEAGGTGNIVEYAHDNNGNVLQITEKQYNQATSLMETFSTSQTYDELNRRVTMVEDPSGLALTTQYFYDSRNNNVKTVDAEGRATRQRFDALGRLTCTTYDEGGLNITVSQGWDDNSNLGSQTDANGNTTSYSYNQRDLQTAIAYADSTVKSFVYNLDDTLHQTTDQNGSVVTNTYNVADLLTNRNIARAPGVGGTDYEAYEWDAANRTTRAENREGTTSISVVCWFYDTLGNADRETQQIGTFPAKTITRVFDGNRNRTQLTYPGGRVIDYVPDAVNRTDTIMEGPSVIADYYYGGQRTVRRDYANGIRLEATYNSVRDITSYKHLDALNNVRCGFDYAFTPTHNKKYERREENTPGVPIVADVYRYDGIYQVTGVKYAVPGGDLDPLKGYDDYPTWDKKEEFDFDGVGNRKTVVKEPFGGTPATTYYNHVGGSYVPDPMNEYYKIETPPETPANRLYDGNGNLTDDGTFLYAYDCANRLLEATRKSDMVVVGQYAYSCTGMRIYKEASEATYFYYDNARAVEERDPSDTVVATNVYGNWIDEILTMTRGGETYFYHANSLGSIHLITDGSGTNAEKYEYDLYGLPTTYTWTGADWQEIPLTLILSRFSFTAREIDCETNVYWYRLRHYSPATGTFVQRDSNEDDLEELETAVANAGDITGIGKYVPLDRKLLSQYQYCLNRPLRFVDPLGLYEENVHYQLTSDWAIEAGFSPGEAGIIALANKGMDPAGTSSPLMQHFMTKKAARKNIRKVIAECGCPVKFGRALHSLQDSYAHVPTFFGAMAHLVTNPDHYDPNDPNDQRMARASKKWLRLLKKHWEEVEKEMRRRIQIPDPTKKPPRPPETEPPERDGREPTREPKLPGFTPPWDFKYYPVCPHRESTRCGGPRG